VYNWTFEYVNDSLIFCFVLVAQLDRVTASEAVGRAFESRRAHLRQYQSKAKRPTSLKSFNKILPAKALQVCQFVGWACFEEEHAE
jgi:hypothetical protein